MIMFFALKGFQQMSMNKRVVVAAVVAITSGKIFSKLFVSGVTATSHLLIV